MTVNCALDSASVQDCASVQVSSSEIKQSVEWNFVNPLVSQTLCVCVCSTKFEKHEKQFQGQVLTTASIQSQLPKMWRVSTQATIKVLQHTIVIKTSLWESVHRTKLALVHIHLVLMDFVHISTTWLSRPITFLSMCTVVLRLAKSKIHQMA